MIKTIKFNGKRYPRFQSEGFASQFAIPFATKLCQGEGYDIGYGKKEWLFPGASGIDENDGSPFDAYNLPDGSVDFIYSSHCLEHLHDWVMALEYWASHIRPGGVLFLYLPHRSQHYWNPWNNRKHLHVLDEEMVSKCIKNLGFVNIFHSERDLNHSFIVVGEKNG